jgi:hypothetical protein
MMKGHSYGRIYLTFLLLLSFAVVLAQEAPASLTENGNSKVAIGASIATTGPGLNLVLGVTKPLSVRLGFEQMAFNVPFSFEENNIDYDADLNFRAGSISIIADYHYWRSLFVSFGAGYNLFRPEIAGVAASGLPYGDIFIPAEDVGKFHFEVEPSHRLSPYLGAGIGRKIGLKKRAAFSMEAGIFYQGPPKIAIEATGLLSPTADEAHNHARMLENQFSAWRFYPVAKMGLSFLLTK